MYRVISFMDVHTEEFQEYHHNEQALCARFVCKISAKGYCIFVFWTRLLLCVYTRYTGIDGVLILCALTDINECEDPDIEKICGAHAVCANVIASYECSCQEGFVGNGRDCTR